jgi:hypothetical protein
MKTIPLRSAVAAVMLLSVDASDAHHSPIMFNTAAAVTITGTVVRLDSVSPHSYLYVDQETADGRVERWAIEGPPPHTYARRGINQDLFGAGATIEACGYLLKEASQGPRGIAGRVLLAELVFMSDAEPILWADYGNRRCREQYGVELTR